MQLNNINKQAECCDKNYCSYDKIGLDITYSLCFEIFTSLGNNFKIQGLFVGVILTLENLKAYKNQLTGK